MKKILFVLLAVFTGIVANAQKAFEGKVVYNLHASNDDKGDAELTVYFAPNRIRLSFKEKAEPDPKYILINLDSGKIYTINMEDKEFKVKKLVQSEIQPTVSRTILGYKTSSVIPEQGGISGLMGGIFGRSSAVFYVSDSLVFNIPAIYANNPELLVVNKGHIVLGASVNFKGGIYEEAEEDSTAKGNIITIEAKEVTPMMTNKADLEIPDGFTLRIPKTDPVSTIAVSTEAFDTTILAAVDTTPYPKQAKPPVKKKPVKKPAPKKSSTSKTATPIRKP